jgi:hypothetical protein
MLSIQGSESLVILIVTACLFLAHIYRFHYLLCSLCDSEELIIAVITSPAFEFDYSKRCKENALLYASIVFRLIMEERDGI